MGPHLRTNLIHDGLLVPNLGIEFELSRNVTMMTDVSFNWMSNNTKHRYWRVLTGEVELRKWFGRHDYNGHHIGIYAALYRYDLEFGGRGWQANLNYGSGLSYGYALRLSRRWSLDFAVGVGYFGGKYKKYDPDDGLYLWYSDVKRHYVGPTKLECTLVWHLGHGKEANYE